MLKSVSNELNHAPHLQRYVPVVHIQTPIPGKRRLPNSAASGHQGKKFRTVNPVYRKIYRYRLCPRNEFRRNFEFFGFKIQKFKKIHKKRKPDFPTGFRCFPVGFRCFPVGKHCFSNVKKYFGIYGIAKELLHMYI